MSFYFHFSLLFVRFFYLFFPRSLLLSDFEGELFKCIQTLIYRFSPHMQTLCVVHTDIKPIEYRECVGVLCLSVDRLHQSEVSFDSSSRYRENMRIAVQ